MVLPMNIFGIGRPFSGGSWLISAREDIGWNVSIRLLYSPSLWLATIACTDGVDVRIALQEVLYAWWWVHCCSVRAGQGYAVVVDSMLVLIYDFYWNPVVIQGILYSLRDELDRYSQPSGRNGRRASVMSSKTRFSSVKNDSSSKECVHILSLVDAITCKTIRMIGPCGGDSLILSDNADNFFLALPFFNGTSATDYHDSLIQRSCSLFMIC